MGIVTFVSTLVIGAVAGWMMEQKHGSGLLRWSRQKMMQRRVLRRRESSQDWE
jgi:hypothetical protein